LEYKVRISSGLLEMEYIMMCGNCKELFVCRACKTGIREFKYYNRIYCYCNECRDDVKFIKCRAIVGKASKTDIIRFVTRVL